MEDSGIARVWEDSGIARVSEDSGIALSESGRIRFIMTGGFMFWRIRAATIDAFSASSIESTTEMTIYGSHVCHSCKGKVFVVRVH